jgi:hypothetical protein
MRFLVAKQELEVILEPAPVLGKSLNLPAA